eukprot:Partr_v1_DN26004_c2_g3_i1_m667 putative NA
MPCPVCGFTGKVISKGWNSSVRPCDFCRQILILSQGPRLVSALGKDYYILCKQYHCNCGANFRSYDPRVLKRLPPAVQDQFPCRVYGKTAIDNVMLAVLSRQVVKKQSFSDVSRMHKEVNAGIFWKAHHAYLSWSIKRSSLSTAKVKPFGNYADANGWRGSILSPQFLARVYCEVSVEAYPVKNRMMQSIKGDILRGDHTFKVAAVPMVNYQRIFEARFSIMNEFGHLLGFWQVQSKSLADLKTDFDMVQSLYGSSGPKVFFTDNCCADRRYLEMSFPLLKSVSLDAFHLMDRYKPSKHHPLFPAFMAFLRDAVFINSEADMGNARHELQAISGLKSEEVGRVTTGFLVRSRNIRRHIPAAPIVASRVDSVIKTFHAMNPQFLHKGIMEEHANVMKHLDKGCLSDTPGVNYYREDVKGKLYCSRGTSQLEGWHLYAANSTAATVASPLMADCTSMDIAHLWNMDRSISADFAPDLDCYDVSTFVKIYQLLRKYSSRFDHDPLNGFDFDSVNLGAPLVPFGCRKVIDDDLLKKLAALKDAGGSDGGDDEISAHIYANENGDIDTTNLPTSAAVAHIEFRILCCLASIEANLATIQI